MGITIKDIAKAAGVSHATVSRALRGNPSISTATRERLLTLARELNYQPNLAARRLCQRRSGAVGVSWPGLGATWVGYLAEQIHRAFLARGYDVIFSMNPPAKAAALFSQQMLDGVVIGGGCGEQDRLKLLRWRDRAGIPLVSAGFTLDDAVPSVDADREEAVKLAVEYLARAGRRGVALISNQPEKRAGYQRGVLASGRPYHAEYVQDVGYEHQAVAGAVARLLSLADPPDALVIGSAQGAFHAVHCLMMQGVAVPDRMAVIGYDEIPGCQDLAVPLTTVGPPAAEMAEAVVDLLLGQAAVPARHLRIRPKLVVRRSCGGGGGLSETHPAACGATPLFAKDRG